MMKKITLTFFYTFLFFFLSPSTQAQNSWNPLGNRGFTQSYANLIDQAFDKNGQLFVAFLDGFNQDQVSVMTFKNNTWTSVGSPIGVSKVNEISLAIDPVTQNPWVAYSTHTQNLALSVAKFDSGSWKSVGGGLISSGGTRGICIAFHPQNKMPYVTFNDLTQGGKINMLRFENGAWKSMGLANYPALGSNMVIGNDGIVYVAFGNPQNGTRANVIQFDTSWTRVGSADFSAGYADYIQLKQSLQGDLYVGFADGASSYKATIMKYSGGVWAPLGKTGFSEKQASPWSMAIDNNGILHVALPDSLWWGSVLAYNNNKWDTVGSAKIMDNKSAFYSLEFNSQNVLHLGFSDGKYSGKATVLKFDNNSGSTATENLEIIPSLFPVPASSTLTVSNIPSGSFITLYNLQGQELFRHNLTSASMLDIPVRNLENGIYILHVANKNSYTSKKLIVAHE